MMAGCVVIPGARRGGPVAAALLTLALLAGLTPCEGARPRRPPRLQGYIHDVPPQSERDAFNRHERILERRKGPAVMVHRGAASFAPENTLEAYAAAMEQGADGWEVDIRRTLDGVLVLYHDDMLDALSDGFGAVPQLTYYELLSLVPRQSYGTATSRTRPPTFAALAVLAREREMLLHLDVKEPGLDDALAAHLTQAGIWDHVVAVNAANAPRLAADRRFVPLKYKGPGLYAGRQDVNPDAVTAQLAQPGEMLMVDDPRVAAQVLQRAPSRSRPLGKHLQRQWDYVEPAAPAGTDWVPHRRLQALAARINPRRLDDLIAVLGSGPQEERTELGGAALFQQARAQRIVERAWAALMLERLGNRDGVVAEILEHQVRKRSLHREWMYHGLDGAIAARALGALGLSQAVPVLIQAVNGVDPELERARDPKYAQYPLAWTDFRVKAQALDALGLLQTAESRRYLQRYLRLGEERAREIGPPRFEAATRALMRHDLSREEIEDLLHSPNPAVRGTAILTCLDRPRGPARGALERAYPWAARLPRAQD